MSSTPAGWYPDPRGQAELRYWDGNDWTEHVHTSAQPQEPAAAPQAQPQQQYAPEPAGPPMKGGPVAAGRGGGRKTLPIVLAIVAVLAIGGVAAFLLLGGEKDEDKIEDAAKAALTGEADDVCENRLTDEFVAKSTGKQGDAAVGQCKGSLGREGSFATGAEISDAKADGSEGEAKAKLEGENFSGQTATVRLEKDGDDWKVAGITVGGDEVTILGGPDPAQAKDDVEQVVLDFGASVGSEGCQYFSEEGLSQYGGRTGCESTFDEAVAAVYTVQDTQVTGREATVTVTDDDGDRIEFRCSFEGGEWKIDDVESA
jgi:hypothetical protein